MTADENKRLTIAYKKCFSTDDGVTVLVDLARFCMEKRTTYTPGDAHQTAFNEGARTVILEIRRRMEMNLEEVKPEQAKIEENQ